MNGILVYDSKYGSTRQYAEWLAESLQLPITSCAKLPAYRLKDFDFLIIGTPVYMERLRIKQWLRKVVKSLAGKKLCLFIVNATSPDEHLKREKFVANSLPAELRHASSVYFLPGRLRHKSLTWMDKLFLRIGARTLTPEQRKSIKEDVNEVKRENLELLIKTVQTFCAK